MAHSPHRRYKGCCLLCSVNIRGDGRRKFPQAVTRQLGQKRRFSKRVEVERA